MLSDTKYGIETETSVFDGGWYSHIGNGSQPDPHAEFVKNGLLLDSFASSEAAILGIDWIAL